MAEAEKEVMILVDTEGEVLVGPTSEQIGQRVDGGRFFWLDIDRPAPETIAGLGVTFGFHPLALEDSSTFGQRPKVDPYEDFAFVVAYGSAPDADGVVEVHCFQSASYLVTLHHDECPAFTELRRRYTKRHEPLPGGVFLLHQVLDALVDSFFPALSDLDDRMDELQDRIFEDPNPDQLHEVFDIRRQLVQVRRVASPQRDAVSQLASGSVSLPGLDDETRRYFRDVDDHLIRLAELVNGYRDVLSGLVDAYMSTIANRRDQVMKQLTVMATLFLPITFLTGFFGQNFGYLVSDLIGSGWAFVIGMAIEIGAVVAVLVLLRVRRWI
jgi:magnesium transporter